MPSQRQPQARIIGDQVFTFAGCRKARLRLDERGLRQQLARLLDAAHIPQRVATMSGQPGQCAGRGERAHVVRVEAGATREVLDVDEATLRSHGNQALARGLRQSLDHAQSKTQRRLIVRRRMHRRDGAGNVAFERAFDFADQYVGRQDRDAVRGAHPA